MGFESQHPQSLIPLYSELAQKIVGSDFCFELSTYIYEPQAISEKRGFFTLRPNEFLNEFNLRAKSLKPREEIAFHSRILSPRESLHIPMIDLGCEDIKIHLSPLRSAFLDFGISEMSVFHTGRSFHVYGHSLFSSQEEALKFIGRILLLNLPGQDRVIDERWVGHRLMAGYLTLRWTNNNPHYRQLPTRLSL